MAKKIKVLIVDDSPVIQLCLEHILQSDPSIEIIGKVDSGFKAIEFLEHSKPDVITMDLNMPGIDGLETTRRILEKHPIPIVIVSNLYSPEDAHLNFEAIQAGATSILPKPRYPFNNRNHKEWHEFIHTIKTLSKIKIIKTEFSNQDSKFKNWTTQTLSIHPLQSKIKYIAVGVSTGGPPVLKEFLSHLPADLPAPILIVQHITEGFLEGLVQWLSKSTKLNVKIAEEDEIPLPGHIYFAPIDYHLIVSTDGRLHLSTDDAIHGSRPSVSCLFRSLLQIGPQYTIAILLTGMGKDGAKELKELKNAGAITIIQDRKSSVVYGMPGEAKKLNAEHYEVSAENLAPLLLSLLKK